MEDIFDVIIIGGGPSGSTAALYTSRASLSTLVLDMSINAGALGITSKIANYPGVLGEISGVNLLKLMRDQATDMGAEFRKEKVTGTVLQEDKKEIITSKGSLYEAKAVILSTGAMGRSSYVKGEKELLGSGVSYCATCDGAFFKGKTALIYGFGEHSIEEAEFLSRFVSKLYYATPKHIEDSLLPDGTELYNSTSLIEVIGENKVEGAKISISGENKVLEVDGVFIYTSGNKPIIDYVPENIIYGEGMCLVVDSEYKLNVPGIFACGDIICDSVQQAVVASSQGCVAALSVDKYIRNRKSIRKDYK